MTSAPKRGGPIVDPIERLAKHMLDLTGIRLTPTQLSIIPSRLQRRLQTLALPDLGEYCAYLEANFSTESAELVSLLTTHHTYFFREFRHYEFIAQQTPAMAEAARKRGDKRIRIWSAGCSTGHEAYSLAMLFDYQLKSAAPDVTFEIFGTDIDPHSVAAAQNGVFPKRDAQGIPLNYLGNHWASGKGDIANFVKAKDPLRRHCSFQVMNLMEIPTRFKPTAFDLILCRNVFIYFEPHNVQKISQELLKHLTPQGYFIIGLSETLNGLGVPVKGIGPSIYVRDLPIAAKPTSAAPLAPNAESRPAPAPPVVAVPPTLRVVCVDDSPSIHKLLSKILVKEEGFEIVGTATNGHEAHAAITKLKPDLVTLDIHMPEMTGIEYLAKHFHPTDHPPVVMLSGVHRDDADLALETLRKGASDYVEKPALSTMTEAADEIRAKLKTAFAERDHRSLRRLTFDLQNAKHPTMKHPERTTRIFVTTLSLQAKLTAFLQAGQGPAAPPTVVLLEGVANLLPAFVADWKARGIELDLLGPAPQMLVPGKLYAGDVQTHLKVLISRPGRFRHAVLVLGEMTKRVANAVAPSPNLQVMIEDLGKPVTPEGIEVVPLTSFLPLSDQFFVGDDH